MKNNSIQSGKRSLQSLLILLLLFINNFQALSSSYYVNSNNGSDINTGSENSAWKTLKPLNSMLFKPGDQVLFACTSNFTGGFTINGTGSDSHPIIFSIYGSGPAPVFTNPDYNNLNGNVIQVRASYVIINGLKFVHTASCTLNDPVIVEDYWKNEEIRTRIDKKVLSVGAVYQTTEAKSLTVKNCEFEDCPIAIYLNGKDNLADSNFIHDCNRVLWDPLWGPIAIVIANSNTEISNNKCINYKREGGTFGADGGFIELDSRYSGGDIHDIYIHHNFSQANEGFIEITNSGSNLNISYNISDDYQQFAFFWEGNNSRIENNTIIRTRPANSGVNVVFTFKNDGYVVRNNIFVLADSLQVFAGGAYDAKNFNQLHENNLYFVPSGKTNNPIGQPAGEGEIIGNPLFRNFKKSDFRLRSKSPAIDAGQDLGYKLDFSKKPVPSGNSADIGAFEYIKTNDN
ncbi:MAG TPA: choice-of-anchor Q domain-containing protein [Prolixibacteraceae bacterium]|nr:choice-of-anchor Q domain-containing protein [Prolixibacteraceae bacterium]